MLKFIVNNPFIECPDPLKEQYFVEIGHHSIFLLVEHFLNYAEQLADVLKVEMLVLMSPFLYTDELMRMVFKQ